MSSRLMNMSNKNMAKQLKCWIVKISLASSFCHSVVNISQGAKCLKCVGIFSDQAISALLLNVSVKDFLKPVNIWWNYDKNLVAYFCTTLYM